MTERDSHDGVENKETEKILMGPWRLRKHAEGNVYCFCFSPLLAGAQMTTSSCVGFLLFFN